jgi:hypothetical protein
VKRTEELCWSLVRKLAQEKLHLLISCYENVGESVIELRYFGIMIIQNYIHKEIKRRLIFGSAVQFIIFDLSMACLLKG